MRRGALVFAVAATVSLAFAAGPIVGWATGATAPVKSALERGVTIRFVGEPAPGMPWQFRPLAPEMELKLGETGLAFYEVINPTDRAIAGTASYKVEPASADRYLIRIACFCASQRVLQAHERAEIPMSFYVDPGIASDVETAGVRTITLSYTFHETQTPAEQASAAPVSAKTITN